MTPDAFRAALRSLGLTIRGFARLVGLNEITCSRWGCERSGRDTQAFPAWVTLLLDAWRQHPELLEYAAYANVRFRADGPSAPTMDLV